MQKICLWIFFISVFTCGCSTQMLILNKEKASKNQEMNYKYRIHEDSEEKTEMELKTNSVQFNIHGEIGQCLLNWIHLCPNSNNVLTEIAGYGSMGEVETIELSYYDIENIKELWRITLDEGGNIAIEDVVFVEDQYVVLKNDQRELICLRLYDGKEMWRLEEPKTKYLKFLKDYNKLLVFDSMNELCLYDPVTGASDWKAPAGYDYPGCPVESNQNIYFVLDGVNKYNITDGLKWQTEIVTDYTESNYMVDLLANAITSLLFGQSSYSSSDPDSYYGCYTRPVIMGDTLLFASLGSIYMIDDNDGEILWQTKGLKDFVITNEIKKIDDNLYLKAGGPTYFYNGVKRETTFETIGKQGLASYNLTRSSLNWVISTDTLLSEESTLLNDYIIENDRIFLITVNEICMLNRMDGSIISQLSSQELRIGNLQKAEICDAGLILKGDEGISLLNAVTLEPVWSRNTNSFPIDIRPSEANLPIWMTNRLYNSYYKTFYKGSFHYIPDKKVVLLSCSNPRSIVGINISDGSLKFELPLLSDKSVVDLNNNIIFDIKNNICRMIDFKKLLNSI